MSEEHTRDNGFKVETRLVHAATGAGARLSAETVGPPIQKASTVLVPDAASLYAYDRPSYGRQGLASQHALNAALCDLEKANHCQLYGSGLLAVTGALMSVLATGDEILVTDGVYQPVRRFCDGFLKRFGVTTRYYPSGATADQIMALATPKTRLILIESPCSLTFELTDVSALTSAARSRGVLTLMDNTYAAGFAFKPLDHGVDLSMQSLTKYVCGHSDTFLGSVCTRRADLWDMVKTTMIDAGFAVAPEDAYQGLRGLRTLATRFPRHAESGLVVANWLQTRDEVARVLHPALPTHPQHELWRRDYTGTGGLFGVELQPMPTSKVEAFLNTLKLFGLGFSYGGFESLAILSKPTRTASPWTGSPLIRLNVGLEAPEDLIADLAQAFDAVRA